MTQSAHPAQEREIRKIVLAYSGGLDTSIIIPWLKEQHPGVEIIGICTNVGQDEDWEGMEAKALASGASKLVIQDIREEFARDFLFPMLRAGAIYEGKYLLGTSIARPLQAKHQVDLALAEGAEAVAHGCTGKGNDQVRFELTYKALAPHLEVIAPWRTWDITSREEAIAYARRNNIPLGNISEKNIYSRDWNIWHMSHEGGDLENPWNRPKEEMLQLSCSPKDAPDKETELILDFEKGIPVGINGSAMAPLEILAHLNKVGGENGIGRADLVETRLVGMKSRGVYETPAGTILFQALRELEMITLDFDTLEIKNQLALRYASLIYAGKWYTHFRESLDSYMETAAKYMTGSVRVVLYKGNIIIAGRKSPYSLYIEDLASFGESSYNHNDATGFINLYGLATGVQALVHKYRDLDEGPAHQMREMASFSEK
ncbi:argininosuccinate synthase [Alkalispirochaeta americana]|uniref:Argininosuccinate synthase n=1 Tax=Alkalispirochaeta americana TaxID=159291 RepID=A0A1N6V9I5_9SPIO|nr:argininosuccinate synthase [Alkalispirochaeta americana]SIQ74543.1 argininosuccinate synthase [Alkalispirochaeta americana]